jgi:hypothetical protein
MAMRLWIASLMIAVMGAPAVALAGELSPHQIAMLGERALPAALPPSALAAAAPVLGDLQRVRLEQSGLPAPHTDAERLARMGRLDRAAREGMAKVPWSRLSPADARVVSEIIGAEMDDVDSANLPQLIAMVPRGGWFGEHRYGREASEAAFTIVQHADLQTQLRFLPAIEAFARRGDANPGDFARMFDRIAMRLDRPQRYGTQFVCENHRWTAVGMEDADRVDVLRAGIHMTETFAQTKARMEASGCS